MSFPKASKHFMWQSQLGHLACFKHTTLGHQNPYSFAVTGSRCHRPLGNLVARGGCWLLCGAAFGLRLACVLPV